MSAATEDTDLTGTYICSEERAAVNTAPAYTYYTYKLEINGNYYKLYSSKVTSYACAINDWRTDISLNHPDPDDQWPTPLPQWSVIGQGYLLNKKGNHKLISVFPNSVDLIISSNGEEITLGLGTCPKMVKQDSQTVKELATSIDGVWITNDEVAADGDYPAYATPRMMLVIDSGHFDLFTIKVEAGSTVEQTIAAAVNTWKGIYQNDNTARVADCSWWNELSSASGTVTQSGSAFESTVTKPEYNPSSPGWDSFQIVGLMSDGTLKIRIPTATSPNYDYEFLTRQDLLPEWQHVTFY